jgi:hypothetical protein
MYRSKLVLWILTAWLAAFVSSAPLADAQDARSTTPKELVFSATPSGGRVSEIKVGPWLSAPK